MFASSVRCSVYSWLLLLVAALPVSAAAPEASYLFPAGARQGDTVTVTVGGSFTTWPVEVWCSSGDLTVEPLEKKGQFQVTVTEEAACGPHWLRFYSGEGASSPRPFLVGNLAEVIEQEPNLDPQLPHMIEVLAVVNGRLSERNDVDTYSVELAQGQTLVAAFEGNHQLASPLDAVMQICDAQGFVLHQNNDTRGLDPLLQFTAPAAGTYLVRLFGFPSQPNSTIGFAGSDSYVYRLTLTTGGVLHHAMPLAVPREASFEVQLFGWNFEPLTHAVKASEHETEVRLFHAQVAGAIRLPVAEHPIFVAPEHHDNAFHAIELPLDISATLSEAGQTDAYRFAAKKGEKLQFRLESRARGFPLDGVLQLVEVTSDKVLTEVDDSNKLPDPLLTATIAADGEYELRVSDLYQRGGPLFAYRLIAEPIVPQFTLSVAKDSFLLSAGGTVEVPVKITREAGYTGEISITASQLPAGVTCTTEVSAAKGDSAKEVKLKLTAAAEAVSGVMHLEGRSLEEPIIHRPASFTLDSFSREFSQIWLTVAPAGK